MTNMNKYACTGSEGQCVCLNLITLVTNINKHSALSPDSLLHYAILSPTIT